MEAEKTLTNEEIIRELLDLLKKNTMKEQANDVFEICTYVDGLEKKIVSMTEELTSMQCSGWCDFRRRCCRGRSWP